MQRLFLSHDGSPISAITPEEMRDLLRYTIQYGAVGPEELVESAGRSAYTVLWRTLWRVDPEKPMLLLAGTGYAGAAGLAALRHLTNHGASTEYLVIDSADSNRRQLEACRLAGVPELSALPADLERYSLVVDALSDGLPELQAPDVGRLMAELARRGATSQEARADRSYEIVAFETPVGVDPTTGVAEANAVWADASIAFALPKTGMGAAECGGLAVADIGLPERVYQRQAMIAHPCTFTDGFIVPLRSMYGVSPETEQFGC